MADLPSGRKKNVSGTGSDVHKKGSGLGTGPVGQNSGSNQIRHDNHRPSGSSGSSGSGSSGSGVPSRAIKGGKPGGTEFGYAARLTELALLGVVAIRTGKKIEWDYENMKAIGVP